MQLPTSLILNTVSEGEIFFFDSDCSIGVPNHPHICVKKSDDEVLIFSCCTSQEGTMNRFIEYKKIDPMTIPWIKGDEMNKLHKNDTFINCNTVYTTTFDEFSDLINRGKIYSTGGFLSKGHFDQIVNGIMASKLITGEIKDSISSLFESDTTTLPTPFFATDTL